MQSVARKCRVILLASEGVANNVIAQQTGLSRPTIIATRALFACQGLEVMLRHKRKRLRRVLTPEVEQKILDTTLKTRPPNATHWSVRTLARHLGLSRTLVHGVWKKYDVGPQRVRFKLSNAPQIEENVRDDRVERFQLSLDPQLEERVCEIVGQHQEEGKGPPSNGRGKRPPRPPVHMPNSNQQFRNQWMYIERRRTFARRLREHVVRPTRTGCFDALATWYAAYFNVAPTQVADLQFCDVERIASTIYCGAGVAVRVAGEGHRRL
jgi:Winged helix-turn helix